MGCLHFAEYSLKVSAWSLGILALHGTFVPTSMTLQEIHVHCNALQHNRIITAVNIWGTMEINLIVENPITSNKQLCVNTAGKGCP